MNRGNDASVHHFPHHHALVSYGVADRAPSNRLGTQLVSILVPPRSNPIQTSFSVAAIELLFTFEKISEQTDNLIP